jgi:hypothetical protein
MARCALPGRVAGSPYGDQDVQQTVVDFDVTLE